MYDYSELARLAGPQAMVMYIFRGRIFSDKRRINRSTQGVVKSDHKEHMIIEHRTEQNTKNIVWKSACSQRKTMDVQQSLLTLRLQAAAVSGDLLQATSVTACLRSIDRPTTASSAFRVYCRQAQRTDGESVYDPSFNAIKSSSPTDVSGRHSFDRHRRDVVYTTFRSIQTTGTAPSQPPMAAGDNCFNTILGSGAYGTSVDDPGFFERDYVWNYIQELIHTVEMASHKRDDIIVIGGRRHTQPQSEDSVVLTSSDDYATVTGSNSTWWMLTVDGKRVFGCRCCSYRTNRKNNLKRHVTAMHTERQAGRCEGRDGGGDRIIMECCGSEFDCKAALREHISSAHRDRGVGFDCPSCGRQFGRKAMLSRHLAVHAGRKDHRCPVCDYATSHKSNLLRHLKVHTWRPRIND